MSKRIIRYITRMLGGRSLSPDSRLVAAVLFMGNAHHLKGGIDAFCGALREVVQYCPTLARLGFEAKGTTFSSKKVETALAEMEGAGFVRWNMRRDQLTVIRDGPARRNFSAEVGKAADLKIFSRSLANAGSHLCNFLSES